MDNLEWQQLCFNVAKEHPEYLRGTIESFSAGIYAQADENREKVANMGAALSMLYQYPTDKQWKKLARERLIESKLFQGTPFEKQLLFECKSTK